LKEKGIRADLVLGLPRGGVVVAAEVARMLQLPLDVLVVRKIGHPLHREFAVGALAEAGVVVLDEIVVEQNPQLRVELDGIIAEENERLRRYQARFQLGQFHDLRDKVVLLVDDGLATGATTEAAVLSARKQGAAGVIVAAPVASTYALKRLQGLADKVVAVCEDPDFEAVGSYYDIFTQTTDDEVLELLRAACHPAREPGPKIFI
jgi:putative phosphoribosyl transferase